MLAWLIVPFAVLAGALTTLQAGSNAALRKSLGEPLPALLINYRLGAATLMASVVTGQVIASVLLDHFGWLGFDVHVASVWRLLGAVLMIISVVLVARF